MTKSEADSNDSDAIDNNHGRPRTETSSLHVTVPSELEGMACIQVAIRKLKGVEILKIIIPANSNEYDKMVENLAYLYFLLVLLKCTDPLIICYYRVIVLFLMVLLLLSTHSHDPC